jgi:hypothetical protein
MPPKLPSVFSASFSVSPGSNRLTQQQEILKMKIPFTKPCVLLRGQNQILEAPAIFLETPAKIRKKSQHYLLRDAFPEVSDKTERCGILTYVAIHFRA